MQGAVTVAVRYGATRQQFGPPDAPEVAVLDYSSQQKKLMPMLASAYALHAATRFLVTQYAEAKRTKEEELVADVHSLSAGGACLAFGCEQCGVLKMLASCSGGSELRRGAALYGSVCWMQTAVRCLHPLLLPLS